nr:MAG TPA: hypothetical protein [Caudoviricetes sp.]
MWSLDCDKTNGIARTDYCLISLRVTSKKKRKMKER